MKAGWLRPNSNHYNHNLLVMSASSTGRGHSMVVHVPSILLSKATTCLSTNRSGLQNYSRRGGKRKDCHVHTLQPAAQLLGEEDNSQLALAVGRLGVILFRLPIQVIKVYVPSNMSQGGQVDDARRGRGLQLVQQQVCQQKVT